MEADKFYHIYNRANGNEKLFRSAENYRYFLQQFIKYIAPIAEIYAYCLIPNHFHFVIKIKSSLELRNLQGFKNLGGLTSQKESKLISQCFSNLFNSYTKAYNKMYNRKGSLFSPNYKKKAICSQNYLQQVILYVHLNPVKHQISNNYIEYPYSSFHVIISNKKILLQRNKIIEIYDDMANFKFIHQQQKIKTNLINELIKDDDY